MCGKNTYDKMFDENAVRNSGNDKVPRIFGPLKNAALNPGILADFHETIDNIFKTGDTAVSYTHLPQTTGYDSHS